ncbi:MAG: hypothetical protein HUU38_30900, partial [Anaerolineales bacterium]|nr:hypothetical protein [Anaerolineales bacterium]
SWYAKNPPLIPKESTINTDLQTQALRERVSKLEAEMRFLYKHLNVTFVPTFEVDPADREVVEWLKKKNEIQAIAKYRAIHMVSLPEAKAAVDEIRAGLGL